MIFSLEPPPKYVTRIQQEAGCEDILAVFEGDMRADDVFLALTQAGVSTQRNVVSRRLTTLMRERVVFVVGSAPGEWGVPVRVYRKVEM